MKKQEFLQRVDEVIITIARNDFQNATILADELDLELLQEPNKLVTIAKAYEKCRRYIDAEDLLELAREYAPKSRSILFHLCNVTTKAGELKKAEDYLEEFTKIARGDSNLYVLQYRLSAAKNEPDDVLIKILENFWSVEPNDRWLYVLAELYAKNGMDEKAIEVCNEITLWFDSGKYVHMAEELRAQLGGVAPDLSGEFDTEGWDPELIADMKEEEEQAKWESTSNFAARKEDPRKLQFMEEQVTEKETREKAFESAEPEEEMDETEAEEETPETPSYSSIYSAPLPRGYVAPTENYKSDPEPEQEQEEEFFGEEEDNTEFEFDMPSEEENEEDNSKVFFPDSFEEEVATETAPSFVEQETEEEVLEVKEEEPEFTQTPEILEEAPEILAPEMDEVDDSFFEELSLELPEETEEKTEEEPVNEAPQFVPVETPENEFELDTEGARALREKTELSMSPDEWDQIVFEDGDIEEAEEEEVPVELPPEEHVVISVTTVEKDELTDIPEVQFDFDEVEDALEETLPEEKDVVSTPVEDVKEEAPAEMVSANKEEKTEDFDAEFVFPADAEMNAAGASDKDMLDMLFESEDGQEAVSKELARRKSEKALFGNIPIRPSADDGLWHFIVYGDSAALTLECAREEIKEIEAVNSSCPEKMLKISASKIKGASIINSLDRFLGCTIIVEEASKLSDNQLRDFTKILDKDDRSLLVIFTDTRDQVIEMLKRMPALGDCFTGIFEGKRYTPDDLVEVAKDYLFTEAAKLSRDGEEAVYEEGRRLLAERKGYYRNDIIEFVGAALRVADKGGFLGLMGGKCDKEGYLIVSAKHFKKANK